MSKQQIAMEVITIISVGWLFRVLIIAFAAGATSVSSSGDLDLAPLVFSIRPVIDSVTLAVMAILLVIRHNE